MVSLETFANVLCNTTEDEASDWQTAHGGFSQSQAENLSILLVSRDKTEADGEPPSINVTELCEVAGRDSWRRDFAHLPLPPPEPTAAELQARQQQHHGSVVVSGPR